MEPLAVTVAEAARLLSQSERAVNRWIASGALPSVKRGRSRRVQVADLVAFNARHDDAATNVTPLAPERRRRERRAATVEPLPAYDGPMPLPEYGS